MNSHLITDGTNKCHQFFLHEVPADIMTVDWKGDTVQPFAENDENRAAIVKVSGETEQKYPVTIKKFRTEEVRYQVQ